MTPQERLWGWRHAFDHPVVWWATLGIGAAIVFALVVIGLLAATGRVREPLRGELVRRTVSWAVMAPLLLAPVLLGAGWWMVAITVLSLCCLGEFARATGLFRERLVVAMVGLGILAVNFAAFDHWYGFFVALFPLFVSLIVATSILPDRPAGYIQRVALGVFAFLLFGCGLAHLSFFGNLVEYRPVVLLVLIGAQLNDVFAFLCGKTLGRHKLAPATSPNKTIEGSLGALVLTTTLVYFLAGLIFAGTPLAAPGARVLLGVLISLAGMLGDLTLSSIKRDLGIKDMGALIPGHGGVLDRANSLLLAAPAVFHLHRYLVGADPTQPVRWFTGP